jgi:hypothetical protein
MFRITTRQRHPVEEVLICQQVLRTRSHPRGQINAVDVARRPNGRSDLDQAVACSEPDLEDRFARLYR